MGATRAAPEFVVRFSENFLEQSSVAALEAFCFGDGRPSRSGLATFGLIWGSRKRAASGVEVIYLDRLFVCLSAKRARSWCQQHEGGIRQMIEVVERLAPHQNLLGFFHSHPYDSLSEVMGTEGGPGYEFSDDDYEFLRSPSADLLWENAHQSPIMAVTTVCPIERVHDSDSRFVRDNVLQYNIGQYRLWFNVAVGYLEQGERACTTNKRSSVTIQNTSGFYNLSGERVTS